jgi:5-methylcytosine-specific restriction endonuclease McrA
MQRVFVLETDRKPLMPCRPSRAKELLKKGKAAVFRRYPFTIIMKEPTGKEVQPISFKVDPGSKTTGVALVADFKSGKEVIWAAEIEHRGQRIRDSLFSRRALRHGRRSRQCRYRAPRFLNRTRPEGWLPPSLESRVSNITTWLSRLRRWSPISSISLELVKFDTQKMENPEISGVEYQQGELQGYEVREYLLEKWDRRCAYCETKDVPLEVEHIAPKSRSGSNRVSNLTLACRPCNEAKGNKTAAEFGHPEIQAKAQTPLKDAAAVNASRWRLFDRLKKTGLSVECGTGGRTKFNRTHLGLPKAHWIDAACVGESGRLVSLEPAMLPLLIRATGHGVRQMCGTNKFGFPIRHRSKRKVMFGFRTGNLVGAAVPKGKKSGRHEGRVMVRASGSFDIRTSTGLVSGVSHRHCRVIQYGDGYGYAINDGGGASFLD